MWLCCSRPSAKMRYNQTIDRGVAQLVARTAGGREVAGSSPVTPTKKKAYHLDKLFCLLRYRYVDRNKTRAL